MLQVEARQVFFTKRKKLDIIWVLSCKLLNIYSFITYYTYIELFEELHPPYLYYKSWISVLNSLGKGKGRVGKRSYEQLIDTCLVHPVLYNNKILLKEELVLHSKDIWVQRNLKIKHISNYYVYYYLEKASIKLILSSL